MTGNRRDTQNTKGVISAHGIQFIPENFSASSHRNDPPSASIEAMAIDNTIHPQACRANRMHAR
jgi:hypothetical protein